MSVVRISAVILAMSAFGAGAPVFSQEQVTEIVSGVTPVVSKIAQETLKEGFVQVVVEVSEVGDVTDAEVVLSYPQGFFDADALRSARTYKFTPSEESQRVLDLGFTFYTDLYESNAKRSMRGGSERGISQANYKIFDDAMRELNDGDLETAAPLFEELKARHDNGQMNVTDAARYFAFLTRFNRLSRNFEDAIEAARFALILARFLDTETVVDGIHFEVLMSLASLGRNHEAVDYYDGWRQVAGIDIPGSLTDYIEARRERGAGKGAVYNVVDFSALRENTARNSGQNIEVVVDLCCHNLLPDLP